MFLESSRYFNQEVVNAITKDGRTVKAVTLRRLPVVSGAPTVVTGNDRLDIMAQRQYNNPTMFWHIADANTELQANDLVKETGRVIKVPEQ
ncbi:MAG: hypothetical protein ACE5JP_00090 [Candidatus Bipolaricaulia bacterium]